MSIIINTAERKAPEGRSNTGKVTAYFYPVTLDDSYPEGGYDLDLDAVLSLTKIQYMRGSLVIPPRGRYLMRYDKTLGKLTILSHRGGEVEPGTDLSEGICSMIVRGLAE